MKISSIFLAFLLLTTLCLASCQPLGETTQPLPAPTNMENEETSKVSPARKTEARDSGDVLLIGLSLAHQNDALLYAMEETLRTAMEEKKVEYAYEVAWLCCVAKDDPERQAEDIQSFIEAQVDLIVVYAFDIYQIESSIQEAKQAGIPIVTYARTVGLGVETQPDAHIGLDQIEQETKLGLALLTGMEKAGEEPNDMIIIEGDYSDMDTSSKLTGLDRVFSDENVDVKMRIASQWDTNKVEEGLRAAIEAYPDCNAICVFSDYMMEAVEKVLKETGKWHPAGEEGHVWIAAEDATPIGIDYIRKGYLDFEISYNLEGMAEEFAEVAFELMEGNRPEPAERWIVGDVVTRENVETLTLWGREYLDEWSPGTWQ